MIALSVSEIEGAPPERHGGEGAEEGLVLEYSSSWIITLLLFESRVAKDVPMIGEGCTISLC